MMSNCFLTYTEVLPSPSYRQVTALQLQLQLNSHKLMLFALSMGHSSSLHHGFQVYWNCGLCEPVGSSAYCCKNAAIWFTGLCSKSAQLRHSCKYAGTRPVVSHQTAFEHHCRSADIRLTLSHQQENCQHVHVCAGVLTSDPRLVTGARPVPDLTYDEATELAFFGATVLHPQAMQPAFQQQLQNGNRLAVRVKNSYNRCGFATGLRHHLFSALLVVSVLTEISK